MAFVYHLCAPDFRGTKLYSLNGLRSIFPDLHRQYLQRQLVSGEPALGFVFIPHLLVSAPVDVSGLEPVDL